MTSSKIAKLHERTKDDWLSCNNGKRNLERNGSERWRGREKDQPSLKRRNTGPQLIPSQYCTHPTCSSDIEPAPHFLSVCPSHSTDPVFELTPGISAPLALILALKRPPLRMPSTFTFSISTNLSQTFTILLFVFLPKLVFEVAPTRPSEGLEAGACSTRLRFLAGEWRWRSRHSCPYSHGQLPLATSLETWTHQRPPSSDFPAYISSCVDPLLNLHASLLRPLALSHSSAHSISLTSWLPGWFLCPQAPSSMRRYP